VITPVWFLGLCLLRHPLWREVNVFSRVYRVFFQEKRLPVSWVARYHKWRYRKPLEKVLVGFSELPPMPCEPNASVELHMLTCIHDLDMAVASLKSLLRFRPQLAVVIHGDSTLTKEHAVFLETQIPGCRVILLDQANRWFADHQGLADMRSRIPDRFTLGAGYERQRAAWALKVLDFHALSQTDRIIVLDSDTLFINRPVELFDWIESGHQQAFYSVPYGPNFRLSAEQCQDSFPGLQYPEKFNGGLFGYSKIQVSTDLITGVMARLMENRELPIYGDECIWRLILAHVPADALPFSSYPLVTNAKPETRQLVDLDNARYVHFILKHRGGFYAQIARRVLAEMGTDNDT